MKRSQPSMAGLNGIMLSGDAVVQYAQKRATSSRAREAGFPWFRALISARKLHAPLHAPAALAC